MNIYRFLLLLIIGLAFPLCIYKPSRKKDIIYISIVFVYMFLITAFRYDTGNDYFNYQYYFYRMTDNNMTFKQLMTEYSFEPGYVILMKLAEFLGGDYLFLNIICAVLTFIPPAYIIYKYSRMPWVSCWLYITITFLYNALNFTRQSIAAAIILLGYKYFTEKKHIKVLIIILIAALFHKSVLILIPIYVFSLIKPTPRFLAIIGALYIPVFIFSEKILDIALKIFSSYSNKYEDTIYLTTGLSPIFIIIPTLLAILVISAHFMGMKDKYPESGTHASFIFCNTLIWFFIVKHFIIERFTLPVYIFTLISVPDALSFYKQHFSNKLRILKTARFKEKKFDKAKQKALKFAYPAICASVFFSTFLYDNYCTINRVHGAFPYRSVLAPMTVNRKQFDEMPVSIYIRSDFLQFMYCASIKDNTIIMCSGGGSADLDILHKAYLKKLGFNVDLSTIGGQRFIGVASSGKSVFEKQDENGLTENISLYDDKFIINIDNTDTININVNGIDFKPDEEMTGLFFVVFDNKTKKVITAQGYDLSSRDFSYQHSSSIYSIDSPKLQ